MLHEIPSDDALDEELTDELISNINLLELKEKQNQNEDHYLSKQNENPETSIDTFTEKTWKDKTRNRF
ncbi:unnamed protein product [Rhizophagus irregularis]|nr:unnamed protein product [Rhizophagus irregularis]CAB4430998.1 unnamed protein product [Rhizophagus irregularis]